MGLGFSSTSDAPLSSTGEAAQDLERVISSSPVPLDDEAWVNVLGGSSIAPSISDAYSGDSHDLIELAKHAVRHNTVSRNVNTLMAHLVVRMRNARASSHLDRRATERCVLLAEAVSRAALLESEALTFFQQLASGPNPARAPDVSLLQRGGQDVLAALFDYVGSRVSLKTHHDLKVRVSSLLLVLFSSQLLQPDVDPALEEDPFIAAALAVGRGADPLSLQAATDSGAAASRDSEGREARAAAARAQRARARLVLPRGEADPGTKKAEAAPEGGGEEGDAGSHPPPTSSPWRVSSRAACVVSALLSEGLAPSAPGPPSDSQCIPAARSSSLLLPTRAREALRRRDARLQALRSARQRARPRGEAGNSSVSGAGEQGSAKGGEAGSGGLLEASGYVLDAIEGAAWGLVDAPFAVARVIAGGLGAWRGSEGAGVSDAARDGSTGLSAAASKLMQPLPLRAQLVLLLLVHNVGAGGPGTNPFAAAVASLRDVRYLDDREEEDEEGAAAAGSKTAASSGAGDASAGTSVAASHDLVADFGRLFDALVPAVETPLGPVLLYTLLTLSPRFKAFCLARSDLSLLLGPLCKQLSYPVQLRTGELYVLVVLVLRLTEDQGVCSSLHAIPDTMHQAQQEAMGKHAHAGLGQQGPSQRGAEGGAASASVQPADRDAADAEAGLGAAAGAGSEGAPVSQQSTPPVGGQLVPKVPWYTDRVLQDVSPGSLLLLALLRAAHHNAAARTDAFLATHLLAAASNMGPHVAGLHPFAADRASRFLKTLCRRAGEAREVILARMRAEAVLGDGAQEALEAAPSVSAARSAAEDLLFLLPQMRELAALLRLLLRPSRARFNLPAGYALLYTDSWWGGVLPVSCEDGGAVVLYQSGKGAKEEEADEGGEGETPAREDVSERLPQELEPLWRASSGQVAALFRTVHVFRQAVERTHDAGAGAAASGGSGGPEAMKDGVEAPPAVALPRRFLTEAEVNEALLGAAVRMARAGSEEAGLPAGAADLGLPAVVEEAARQAGPVRAQHFAYAAKDDPEQFYVPFVWEAVAESTPDLGWVDLGSEGASGQQAALGGEDAEGGGDAVQLIDLSDLGLHPSRKVVAKEEPGAGGGALQDQATREASQTAGAAAGGAAAAAVADDVPEGGGSGEEQGNGEQSQGAVAEGV